MCGRYELHSSPATLAFTLSLKHPPDIQARYNIAPTQHVPIVRLNRDDERELSQVRWGLVPFWAKDPSIGSKMINARSETIATKPGFREAYRKARCLIPASGLYEWAKMTDDSKQPVRVAMRDEDPFAFAGLWSRWGPKDGEQLETCTIITTEANELCQPVHDRMPVIRARENYERWRDVSEPDPADLLCPFDSAAMRAYPVSTRVNSPKNDDAELIAPLAVSWGVGSLRP